jgi:TctA family transporter
MKYLKLSLVVTIVFSLLLTTGCTGQATLAALVDTLGGATAAVAQMQGNPTLAAQLRTDTAAAVAAISNWKSGSPSDLAIEAIDIVITDLNLIPGVGPYAPLISLALTTAEAIIRILAPKASPQMQLKMRARLKSYRTGNPSKNADQFKKQWNAICGQNSQLSGLTI